MITPEDKVQMQELEKRAGYLWRYLDCEGKKTEIDELEQRMSSPTFWDDQDEARKVSSEVNRLKQLVEKLEAFRSKVDDLVALAELVDEAGEEGEEFVAEFVATLGQLNAEVDDLEISSFLNEPFDGRPALLSIHAGAGGTESCDWADMLMRMYVRWAERRGFDVEVQDAQPGEEAGISRCSIRIAGLNAYGYSKAERGVHRLVRISPFDSNKRRHTSFCSVDVIAELDDDADVEVNDDDLRIDTYRASGKGGQHVNKTDSAVRITHLPTNIVVQCQNERSQHKNKQTAMRALKSRLYEQIQDEKRAEMEKFYGDKGEMGWGNQIRSYVFQPYQMVKDLRTGVETSNVQGVMDGDLDTFVNGWLRAGCPRQRNKDIQLED
ncbi:MAG: peptide chain release factor 2 [Opitutae bacterium]|nr:peptide chain release factor 2 [Opitutae bacterium]